jgi:hypothetical protein
MGGGYTLSVLTPTPRRLFLSFVLVASVLFVRPPSTNFIFDEQEALLGNPYLQDGSDLLAAFSRDFWGRGADQTIGAYRPLPNVLWKPLAVTVAWHTPWFFCLVNLLMHAATASIVSLLIARFLKKTDAFPEEGAAAAWGGGVFFLVCATSTEAVCSAVGLADILVGFFSALCLWLLSCRTLERNWRGPLRLFALISTCFVLGMFSKETMIATLFGLPVCAWLMMHDRAEGRLATLSTLAASVGAISLFVWARNSLFFSKKSEVAQLVPEGPLASSLRVFFSWFSQPKMPVDPLNNPLFEATASERMSTAFSLFAEQVAQILLPTRLYADYSYPRQVLQGWNMASLAGLFLLILVGALVLRLLVQKARGRITSAGTFLLLVGLLWMLISYLPVSNSLVLLPTIRADRLLYPTVLGASLAFAGVIVNTWARLSTYARFGAFLYLCFQGVQARVHALIYWDDVAFWRATSRGEHASAKSLLNMGVMVGARGDEVARISYTEAALHKAPDWPMGRVYLGDAYCRAGDVDNAYLHLKKGFQMAPQSKALTALGLQCLWEKGGFSKYRADLLTLAEHNPETWLDYLVSELEVNGDEHGGIPERYRPRKYNARANTR